MIQTSKKKPDLIGFIAKNALSYFSGDFKLGIVEVKPDYLVFNDIYQLKLYAEMLSADYAFLISPKGFKEVRRRFLIKYPLLQYLKGKEKKEIAIFKFLKGTKKVLQFDGELYRIKPPPWGDPFE